MTAAIVEASCSVTMRSSSSASSAPCSGSPRVKAFFARQMRVRHVVDAGQQRAEHLAVGDDAADRDAAEIDAVIAALAADQAEARAVALGAMIGERDLQRGVDRFRTGIGEEHVVEALRRDVDQPVGEFEDDRVAHLEGRRVVELGRLLLDRLGDLRAAVAGIDAPQPGRAVEHLAAVGRRVVHVLGGHEHARRLLELPVRRERHPECAEIVRRDFQTVRHDQASLNCPCFIAANAWSCLRFRATQILTDWTNVSTAR